MLKTILVVVATLLASPLLGQTSATVEVIGHIVYLEMTPMEDLVGYEEVLPTGQITGGGHCGSGGGGAITPPPPPPPPPSLVSYYAEWVSNEYKYPFRQIAKIESPSGAKISFQNVDSLKRMWNYEISLKFAEFGVSLGGGYESMNTVTIGWEMQLPDLAGTYVAVANEGIINDYYDIVKKTVFGSTVIANNQLAQKHDKITVELYRNGTKIN